MRIAQIAPLYEAVPPRLYGGTERIVSWLTEALTDAGHEVTLFASSDSSTAARLQPVPISSLRLAATGEPEVAAHYRLIEDALRHADEFDVLHFHTDYLHYPFMRRRPHAHLTTLHGRLDLPGMPELYAEYADEALVSISDDQRRPLPRANWIGTVQHGMPLWLHRAGRGDGGYLAFLGRISPEKGPERAIAIAKRTGIPLRIAAKVDPADRSYFEAEIRPLLDHPLIEFIGEVNETEKSELLRGAMAVLFPIDWPEPFGLVMIEAMACGTPTIAFRAGSVPEVIDEGVSGFIVASVDEAVDAVGRLHLIDRASCRARFEKRFAADRMADDYVRLYERLISVPSIPRLRVATA